MYGDDIIFHALVLQKYYIQNAHVLMYEMGDPEMGDQITIKGQTISNANFGVLNSPKKRSLE